MTDSIDSSKLDKPVQEMPLARVFSKFKRFRNRWSELHRQGLPGSGARTAIALCEDVITGQGEASGDRAAKEVLATWTQFEQPAREAFLDLLSDEFSADPARIQKAADEYGKNASPRNYETLRRAVDSPRLDLFRSLNGAPGGTAVLIDMRGHIVRGLKKHPGWEVISDDLAYLFEVWFSRGLLELRRLDWRTPAVVLEKIIHYEAVHQIQGWPDLRRRLEADRRCYGFFHPALPDDPIIFIEVALTVGISDSIHALLNLETPVARADAADSAVFYSITNCQEGLKGIPFGNFLIKRVAEDIQRDLPGIRKFATLSPVPGFRKWLLAQSELTELNIKLQDPTWLENASLREELRAQLMPLCAHYLLHAKYKGSLEGVHEPMDPVARFHLRNGASLARVNWLADTSPNGLRGSAGLMVNYRYRLSEVEQNYEAYTRKGQVVASSQVLALAAKAPSTKESGKPSASAKRPTDRVAI